MVHVAAAIVAHGGADRFGNFVELREQIFDGKLLQVGRGFERLVEIGDVGVVMLVVVNLHRLRVNVWFERVERIRKRRQCVSSSAVRLLVQKWTACYLPP